MAPLVAVPMVELTVAMVATSGAASVAMAATSGAASTVAMPAEEGKAAGEMVEAEWAAATAPAGRAGRVARVAARVAVAA